MRLERLTANKIKIFLTSDDLFDRGLCKEDIWKESKKWNQLFHDILEKASNDFKVNLQGAVAVEIFSIQAQGMIMIITVDEPPFDDEKLFDGFIEMQVMVEGTELLLYEFDSIDDVIDLSKRLAAMHIKGGQLYALHGRYYILIDNIEIRNVEKVAAILAEYGDASIISPHILEEYGTQIIDTNAVETLLFFFK